MYMHIVMLLHSVNCWGSAAQKNEETDEFAVKLEQAATKHPQVLYEAKVLKILSGGGAFIRLCVALSWFRFLLPPPASLDLAPFPASADFMVA